MATGEFTGANDKSQADGLISITDIIAIIRKRWCIGAVCGAIVAGLLMAVLLSQEKLYEAEASMTIELSTANVMDFREVMDTSVTHVNLLNTFMNTHMERIQTRGIAEAVVRALTPEQVEAVVAPYYDPATAEKPADAPGLIMSKMLSVEQGSEEESQVILIHIVHHSPQVAQFLANEYVRQYIAYKANLRNSSTGEAVHFLGKQVEEMRTQLEGKELELQEYRQSHNLVSVQQDQGILGERLRRINDALTDANLRLLEVETLQQQIQAAGKNLEKLMEIPVIGGREDIIAIYSQLNELQRERLVLDETYLARHPKVIENEASLKSVKAVLKAAISQAVNQIENDHKAAVAELTTLEGKLKEGEQAVLDAERALVEYNRMQRNLDSLRDMYNKLSTRYAETSIAQQLNLNNVSLLEPAGLPTHPMVIAPVQILAASMFLGGVFFICVPLVIELLDHRLASFTDVERFANKPLLGDIRQQGDVDFKALSTAFQSGDLKMKEPLRAIYSSIRMRSSLNRKKTSFLVTSSLPGEGKSMVTANLAAVIASHGMKVLLIDFDLRRPMQHNAFGLDNDSGLIPWFDAGSALPEKPDEAATLGITQVQNNLSLLRSGGSSQEATEILSSNAVKALMSRLAEDYDVLLYDTPPVGLFPDAGLVAEFAQESIFVARQFKVTRQKMRYSIAQMDRSPAPVMGVVFNGIKNVKAAIGYGSAANLSYGHGYEKDASKYAAYYAQRT
ncbi:GumC family protein [Coraliomargarita parva]|uniref:GumC family protein n=1 Tax=Coraliomargarita parva TaxID=3014050 RepID=UPI0022B2F4EA|nr:polysaccharide biosynthesis tyrosine autokinase [Coraliomargarita parva]